MANENITFDKLPQAVGYLTEQVERIHQMVAALQPQVAIDKHRILRLTRLAKLHARRNRLSTRSHVTGLSLHTSVARNSTSMWMNFCNGLSRGESLFRLSPSKSRRQR